LPESPTVLLVDDNAEYRRLLARVLRIDHGIEAFELSSALAALTFLEAEPVTLVVADLRMPGLDGRGLLDVVGKRWPGIRRMLLSAFTTGEMVAGAGYPVIDKGLSGWLICERIADLARQ
jgi:CheY-like chemotaxis protein